MRDNIKCTYDEEKTSTWTNVDPSSPLETISRVRGSRQRNDLLSLVIFITLSSLTLFIYVREHGFYFGYDWALRAGARGWQNPIEAQCAGCLLSAPSNAWDDSSSGFLQPEWTFQYGRDGRNEGLDRDQCRTAFPALFEEITRATRFWSTRTGKISTKERLDAVELKDGMGRALIYDGELYVVATRADGEAQRRSVLTALGAIHRALVASPRRSSQTNIEFVFSVEDRMNDDVLGSGHPVWTLSRTSNAEAVWLMPGLDTYGEYNQVVKSLERTERQWFDKESSLALRGSFNSASIVQNTSVVAGAGDSSNRLVGVQWYNSETEVIGMEYFCNSRYIAHVEGESLKYDQVCRSVVFAPNLERIRHFHHLLVPDGYEQNYVRVENDFSDLAEKIMELIHDPPLAEHIADNNVRTLREWYGTSAADACYWRALFDGYSLVFSSHDIADDDGPPRGLQYEFFILLESRSMLYFNFPRG